MKLTRSVFILLIGMISLTVFSTTTELGQKSKTEYCFTSVSSQDQIVPVAVSVVAFDSQITNSFDKSVDFQNLAISFSNERPFKTTPVATITDVGWYQSYKITITPYKEKLRLDFNLDFISLLNKRKENSKCQSRC